MWCTLHKAISNQRNTTMKLDLTATVLSMILATPMFITGCGHSVPTEAVEANVTVAEGPEWFNLRPELEKAYGYTHAVRIGDHITISGAVSMDDHGNPTAVGDFAQQMKNCYSDLGKVLKHYDCTFDDVIVENVFTTNMAGFLEHAAYRNEIYTKQFPAGSWSEVKGLVLPEFLIEIELEVYKVKK